MTRSPPIGIAKLSEIFMNLLLSGEIAMLYGTCTCVSIVLTTSTCFEDLSGGFEGQSFVWFCKGQNRLNCRLIVCRVLWSQKKAF